MHQRTVLAKTHKLNHIANAYRRKLLMMHNFPFLRYMFFRSHFQVLIGYNLDTGRTCGILAMQVCITVILVKLFDVSTVAFSMARMQTMTDLHKLHNTSGHHLTPLIKYEWWPQHSFLATTQCLCSMVSPPFLQGEREGIESHI